MTANSQAKLKLLCIMQMLQDETDSTCGLSMNDIIQRLGEQGIQAERKSVYRDIDLLRQFGLDVRTFQRNPVQYAIVKRNFTMAELELMADAVQSCRHITQRQADALIRGLKGLAPKPQRAMLSRRIHVAERVQRKSESVLNNVDAVHRAFAAKRKLVFDYDPSAQNDADSERCRRNAGHNGHCVLTPVAIVCCGDSYFLTCWDDDTESFVDFRMEHMANVALDEHAATRNDAIRDYQAQARGYDD